MSQKLDILAFGPHPDDVEAWASGLLLKYSRAGKRLGIVDLSQAELATNGSPKERKQETKKAQHIIGAQVRKNLQIPDAHIFDTPENRMKIVEQVRAYQPEIVLAPYWDDRHPDHHNAGQLIYHALFKSGLKKIESEHPAHRPSFVFFYRLWHNFEPSFIVDISDVFEKKIKALLAYRSQFFLEDGRLPTKDHENDFLDYFRARHRNYGYEIGVKYGEPYLSLTPIGIKNLESLLPNYS